MNIESKGFVLHTRPYKETSFLVDIFSENHGRVRCVAKGYRRSTGRQRAESLSLFVPYNFTWRGKNDLKTLVNAETCEMNLSLSGERLFVGLYVNELLYNLLAIYDPSKEIYAGYFELVNFLGTSARYNGKLRCFELLLLEYLGYGLVLDVEYESGNTIDLQKKYKYLHGYGLSPFESQSENRDVYVGADLLAIQDQRFDDIHIEKVARRLIRSAIDYQLDGKVLNSRKLYQQYLASTKSDSNIGQC